MSDSSRHLTESDFERLLGELSEQDSPERDVLRTHAAQCAECSDQLALYRRRTEQLRGHFNTPPSPGGLGCPPPEQIVFLAVGVMDQAESNVLMEHVAGCDACGALLKVAMDERDTAGILAETSGVFGELFVARTASALRLQSDRGAKPAPPQDTRWWYVAAIAAGVLLCVLGAKVIGLLDPTPEQLVARAYEANRTWPIRMEGASYIRQKYVERSAAPASATLAEAEAVVLKGFGSHAQDLRWRQLRSRVDFLHRRYSDAIADLEPLDQGQVLPAELLIDLGTAYLGRGMAENQASDKTRAIEYFGRALRSEPRNPVALFNQALAAQETMGPAAAEQAWRSYLAVDSSSGWAEEARELLRESAQKKSPGSRN